MKTAVKSNGKCAYNARLNRTTLRGQVFYSLIQFAKFYKKEISCRYTRITNMKLIIINYSKYSGVVECYVGNDIRHATTVYLR